MVLISGVEPEHEPYESPALPLGHINIVWACATNPVCSFRSGNNPHILVSDNRKATTLAGKEPHRDSLLVSRPGVEPGSLMGVVTYPLSCAIWFRTIQIETHKSYYD
jgi:hypothetical protein